MNSFLINSANLRAKDDDYIIHVGDFCCFGADHGLSALNKVNPSLFASRINATFVNIMGNHDYKNKVKSIGNCLFTSLGEFKNVSISHHPSYSPLAIGQFRHGDIHICGHVHGEWKYNIDFKNSVLNINVGVDAWNYQIVSEEELISYIQYLMSTVRRNQSLK